jgi:hypothetical protein
MGMPPSLVRIHAADRRRPATLAGFAASRHVRRIGVWTLGWTLFQWWAVIGWPEHVTAAATAPMLSGVLTLMGIAVWQDVRREPVAPLVAPAAAPRRLSGRPDRERGPDQLAA